MDNTATMNRRICAVLSEEREYRALLRELVGPRGRKPKPVFVSGVSEGAAYALTAALVTDCREARGGALLLSPNEQHANRIRDFLADCGLRALIYPQRDLVFHPITASHDQEHERLSVLSAILADEYDVIIAPPDAALAFTMPPSVLQENTMVFRLGDEMDPAVIARQLAAAGYARTDAVDGVGQFAVRGGIVDIFPPFSSASGEHGVLPIRMELFGDEIDRISAFDPMTQRAVSGMESCVVPPCREILVGAGEQAKIADAIDALLAKTKDNASHEALLEERGALLAGNPVADKYISLLYPEKTCLFDYMRLSHKEPLVLLSGTGAVDERLTGADFQAKQTVEELLESGLLSPKYAAFTYFGDDLHGFLETANAVHINTFAPPASYTADGLSFGISSKQTVSYAANPALLREDLDSYLGAKYRVLLMCETETDAAHMVRELAGEGYTVYNADKEPDAPFPIGAVGVFSSPFPVGFELPLAHFALLSFCAKHSLMQRRTYAAAKKESRRKPKGEKIFSYADLSIGDYVVHAAYGIGLYTGIETLTAGGVTRDYINIQYAGTDRLFLPVDQLDLVSKYIGARSSDGEVKLSKMGGADWNRAKSRVKAAAKEMAGELIRLYAERIRREGFAFPPDDDFQRDFDGSFEFEETSSQLDAIDDIKRDMERPYPMDRLLCGDVGYGKTEVALRGAFKAIMAGKQVALLVPTTILALQHFNTATARMRAFPIRVEMISRFRTADQIADTLRRLRAGEVDLIIGTHRLLSADVAFSDLGLLIIDEEQRFGVAQKEKLKQLAKNVDVLTLTATPIPRTLNMAMGGIRDMSVLHEAPYSRMPVQTYVLEHDDAIIAEAIRKELRRGGQVFYLYNRVESIYAVAARITREHPEARIAVAHGKMEREELENIWNSMLAGETDILISTTIIETGVDVANANTLIIEDADRLGLAQLHQIRGRVGRSYRRAYAYFTYRRGKTLSEISEKRLAAIREFAEFGAGFKIALRDMEIRGAGNLLGAQQHGHMESVGYDLYIKLLNEAVLEEKGETPTPRRECIVDVSADAFLPESFVSSSTQRMELYRKIAQIETEEDHDDMLDELADRFGEIPRAAMGLVDVALARALAIRCEIDKIEERGGAVTLVQHAFRPDIWTEVFGEVNNTFCRLRATKSGIVVEPLKKKRVLDVVIELFKKYIQISEKTV